MENLVEVFKTNVREKYHAQVLIHLLLQFFPECEINFDLDDCDKILRIEGVDFVPEKVKSLVRETGFTCDILD